MPTRPRTTPPSQPVGPHVQVALEDRRVDLQTKLNQVAVPYVVSGLLECSGLGSGSAVVQFGVLFANRPTLAFGGDVIAGSISQATIPNVSGTALSWILDVRGPQNPAAAGALFAGVNIGIVISGGPSDLHMNVHWSATGLAFRRAGGADGAL